MKRLTILAVVLVLMLCGCNSQSDNTASSTLPVISSDIAEESEECSFSAGKSDSTAPQISTAPAEQEEASEPSVTSEPPQQAVPSEPAEKPAESTENASEPAEKPAEPPSTEGSGQTESVPETSRQPEASTPAAEPPAQTEPPDESEPPEMPEQTEPPAEETRPEQSTPPEAEESAAPEFDIQMWIDYAAEYAGSVGLNLSSEATACWDNPITAGSHSLYLERDIESRLNRYSRDEDITDVWIWAEERSDGSYDLYIGYA